MVIRRLSLLPEWQEEAEPEYEVVTADVEQPTEVTWPQKPRDYQVEGIDFMQIRKRCFNTDQPGLGKTLQGSEAALGHLPALIACPTYLVPHWEEHLTSQYPDLRTSVAKGFRAKRAKALAAEADFYVINHQMYRDHKIPNVKTVINDESHHLRNRTAQMTKGAFKVAHRPDVEQVFNMTATPIWKEVDDLWSQLHMLQPKLFSSYWRFVDYFCATAEVFGHTKILGVKSSMRDELDAMLDILRIGRTPDQVGRSLPEMVEHYVKFELPDPAQKLYDQTKATYTIGDIAIAGTILHTLRQITANAGKIEIVVDLVEDLPKDDPVLIFTWYKDHAQMIARKLGASLVTGDVKAQDRRALAMGSKRTVATIASLSEGVNMSHCRHVVFCEENWPPASNYQALSRVRRDVGSHMVNVYYVHARRTVDEAVHRISKRRQASIRDVLEETLG